MRYSRRVSDDGFDEAGGMRGAAASPNDQDTAGTRDAAVRSDRPSEAGGKPSAAVAVDAVADQNPPGNLTSLEAPMSRLEIARANALAAGRKPPRIEEILDRALARAGLARSARRGLIAALKAEMATSDKNERTGP